MRHIPVLLLLLVLAAPVAEAGDPAGVLARRTEDSPRSLDHIIGSTLQLGHWPLRAEMVLDTDGRLMARVLIAIVNTPKATQRFESWSGYIESAGWVPQKRALAAPDEVEQATRLLELLGERRHALGSAVGGSIRNEENPAKPADFVISAAPVERDGELRVALLVSYDGAIKGVEWNPEGARFRPMARPDHTKPIKPLVRSLPPLKVPGGAWFNVEEDPAPESWRGKPLLVVTTDPG